MKGTDNWPVPETKEECLEVANRWGSTLSHWNQIHDPERVSEAIAFSAMADAAEVARLSALYSMLPSLGDVERAERLFPPSRSENEQEIEKSRR